MPHPFGSLSRAVLREVAEQCVSDIEKLVQQAPADASSREAATQAVPLEVADDADAVNRMVRARRWSDGLPVVPPTADRVDRMLQVTSRCRTEVVATIPPGFGCATVEKIAINAVMAGCEPEYLPILIAAVDAITAPEFNLQGIQTTTNPAAVWLIVNGPIGERIQMNAGINCFGQGNWANATLGRALRLIMQNIGAALPGEMDRATLGQPGKYLFCCAENERASPWEPLHVERGYSGEQSTVTVVGAEGTLNLNTHSKDAQEVLRIFGETLARPSGNDYFLCGEPWIVLSPETAQILGSSGLDKMRVKQRLWENSMLLASRMTDVDLNLTRLRRGRELGEIDVKSKLPICSSPASLGILVCGGPGTHSMYVPSFGNTRSVTREVIS